MWSPDKFVLFATKDGTVKKTALDAFKNYRKDGIIAINIEEGNDLVDVVLTTGKKEICFVTHEGMCLRFHEDDTRLAIGRGTAGVRGHPSERGDFVVGLALVTQGPAHMLLVAERERHRQTHHLRRIP
jgi:DNA gyrase subunit A